MSLELRLRKKAKTMDTHRIIEYLAKILDVLNNPPVKRLDIIEIDDGYSSCRSHIKSIELSAQGPIHYCINVGSGDGATRTIHVLRLEDAASCKKKYEELLRLWKGEANGPS